MPDNLIAVNSGEMADPVNKKARRSYDRQAANHSGGILGPTEQPGIPDSPTQGTRRNGNFAKDLGGGTAFTPGRRKRGSR